MLRTLTDKLYGKNATIRWFKRENPAEEVLFASAATVLETKEKTSTGWSLQRLFQHRGVVIITRNQIVLKSSFISISTVLFSFFLIISINSFLQTQDPSSLLGIIVFSLLIAQRFPYNKQIYLTDIEQINTKGVSGLTGKYSLLTIYVKDKAINIVPAQHLDTEVIETISIK